MNYIKKIKSHVSSRAQAVLSLSARRARWRRYLRELYTLVTKTEIYFHLFLIPQRPRAVLIFIGVFLILEVVQG